MTTTQKNFASKNLLLPEIIAVLAITPVNETKSVIVTWHYYNNVKYGFVGCYPSDLFTGRGEFEAGSGQEFTAPDGAGLKLYGVRCRWH